MTPLSRQRPSGDQQLSEYVDGELDVDQMDAMAERLTLNPDAKATLQNFLRVDALAELALKTHPRPSLEAALQRILAAAAADTVSAVATVSEAPRRRLKAALLASAGLLVTAGVAFVGLRRRIRV